MNKTKYRTVSNGFYSYLQYQHIYNFIFFKIKIWRDVRVVNKHRTLNNLSLFSKDYDHYRCNGSTCKFIEDNPDITEYLKQYKIEREDIIKADSKWWKDVKKKRGTVKYLN